MKSLARQRSGHPLVQQLARNILLNYNVESQNYIDEALAIGDYVKRKVRYVRDPDDIEQLQDPLTMIDQLKRGVAQGDCDDIATLIATLLLSVGHRPEYRAVRYRSYGGPYNHIYVIVRERNWKGPVRRIVLDGILKRDPIGTEVPHSSGDDYPI